jgi:putative addiction module component (TIGR02574 family)
MQTTDYARLPLPERLAAMEALWDSLSHDPNHDPSPAWHAQVLAQRRHEMTQGQGVPWDQAKRQLRALANGNQH